MPNRNEHILIGAAGGALFGLAQYVFDQQQGLASQPEPWSKDDLIGTIGALGLGALAGAIAAQLPDLIDPPDSPNHRSIGHGIAGTSILASQLNGFMGTLTDPSSRILVRGFQVGYISHVAADATTPKGIPLFY